MMVIPPFVGQVIGGPTPQKPLSINVRVHGWDRDDPAIEEYFTRTVYEDTQQVWVTARSPFCIEMRLSADRFAVVTNQLDGHSAPSQLPENYGAY